MKNIHDFIVECLKYLVIILVAGIVVVVSAQVFSRFVLGDSSSITEELARFILIWIGLFGGAYGYHTNVHLGLDVVVKKMSHTPQLIAGMIAHLCVLGFAVIVMIYGGLSLVQLTLDPVQISAAMQIKMAYVYLSIPISGLLIVMFAITKLHDSFMLIVTPKEEV